MPTVDAALIFYQALQTQNGGDVHIGRRLGALLRAAGCIDIQSNGTYECYADATFIAEYLALQIEAASGRDLSKDNQEQTCAPAILAAALRTWSRHPDALFAQAWLAAIGRTPV